MTIGELKKLIADLPDDMEVLRFEWDTLEYHSFDAAKVGKADDRSSDALLIDGNW